MADLKKFKTIITDRIAEIDARLQEIEHELDKPKTADLNDQAIDLEDDEVLESLGLAGQDERSHLLKALERIDDGSYGVCAKCEEDILEARLEAVPYAVLCRNCARGANA